MIKSSILFLSLVVHVLAVEPKSPREVKLDPETILDINLNEKVTTVLQFKESVSMVSGAGLTDGTTAGLVQFEHPKASRRIVLRSLGQNGRVLMQVVTGGETFVFRLNHDQNPDSLVRLVNVDRGATPSIPVDVSPAKAELLLQQAKQALLGNDPEPSTFVFEARAEGWQTAGDGLEVLVDKVGRASSEDALIVKGRIRSIKEAVDVRQMTASLSIGPTRLIPATIFQVVAQEIEKKQDSEFFLLIIGDGQGLRGNFSIRNRFGVRINLRPR